MVNVSMGGSATDVLSGITPNSFKVTDEYGTIGLTLSDFNTIIQLESWRNGDDLNGRIYTTFVTTKDKADNQLSSSTTVICPHDKGKR